MGLGRSRSELRYSEVGPEPGVEFILYSHPAIGKRIAMAEACR
jgi:hypothetical protein